MKSTFLTIALTFLGTCAAWAGSICPAGSGGNPFPHIPDAAGTGCNVLITINADRSTTVTIRDSTAYENSDDMLLGVQNNSSSTVPSLTLTGSGIFGFESDGMCIYTFVGSGYCSANGASIGTDPYDYAGPTSTFTNISSANTGTVNFSPAIAPGGSTYFSLEGAPSSSLTIAVASGGAATGAPALSTWAVLLLASMLLGYALWVIRKQRQHQG